MFALTTKLQSASADSQSAKLKLVYSLHLQTILRGFYFAHDSTISPYTHKSFELNNSNNQHRLKIIHTSLNETNWRNLFAYSWEKRWSLLALQISIQQEDQALMQQHFLPKYRKKSKTSFKRTVIWDKLKSWSNNRPSNRDLTLKQNNPGLATQVFNLLLDIQPKFLSLTVLAASPA